jgi:hypothetical protein
VILKLKPMEFTRIVICKEDNLYLNIPEPYKTETFNEYNDLLNFIMNTFLEQGVSIVNNVTDAESLDDILLKIRRRLSNATFLAFKQCKNQSVALQFDTIAMSRVVMTELKDLIELRKKVLKKYNEITKDKNLW